ncbi:MAG TPA: protein kinase [Gemmatimonadaceae bacterium]|nr:protein kinase [Gemmatimonadaceae bacterium]
MQREVLSLLAAHDRAHDEFLERPAVEAAVGAVAAGSSDASGAQSGATQTERLAKALAGRYEIEREIARGGMATVHLARDLRHDRRVAIKVLREELTAAVGAQRFLEEIRVTASLQHPHILALFDSGSADGLLWYVMPYVEGETLRSRLEREGRLSVQVSLQLVRQMAEALDHAHRHGVVHRDVKPENVLLQTEGGHALVADFGIALALEHAGGERLTRTGITLGTPQYMAPEQAKGERAIDARTDVYALGAVLHEMIAGEAPFAAASRHAVLQRVLHVQPLALATRRADVPSSVDATVQRALSKRPDERFASAAAFAASLDAPVEPVARADASAPSPERVVSVRTALYAAGAMLVLGLVGGLALGRPSFLDSWTSAVKAALRPSVAAGAEWKGGPVRAGGMSLTMVDRAGRPMRTIAANRPWTPRFSPDGSLVAYGAFGAGRSTSDIYVTDLKAGTTKRLTDDDGDNNDPQWSGTGAAIAYSSNSPGEKDLLTQKAGGGDARTLAAREGIQYPSDWLRDGSALLVSDQRPGRGDFDIIVQPADGSPARPYVATRANESAARISPDGRWVAYTSDESGRNEVYLDSYSWPGRRVSISQDGGLHPVWRGDGRELYYWNGDALVAVRLSAPSGDAPPAVESRTVLFRMPIHFGANTMYDVSPDGQRFVIVRQP